MADLERTYNVPLRRACEKAPLYKRAKTALRVLKEFMVRHMKSENIKIGRHANLKIWEKGIKHPPHHIKVTAIKDKDGLVRVELAGRTYEDKGKETKKEEKKKEEPKKEIKEKKLQKPAKKKEEKPQEEEKAA